MKKWLKSLVQKNAFAEKYVRLRRAGGGLLEMFPKKRITGKGNLLRVKSSALLRNCTITMKGNGNSIEIGDFCSLNHVTILISGKNNSLRIGSKVSFRKGGAIWIQNDHCEATIGELSTFVDAHIAVTESNSRIVIGQDCMFANDIDLRTGDSHSIMDTRTGKRINHAQDVTIGNHVWVGAHVSILKGAVVADDSVVATRSVVTRAFEETNVVLGGAPAKILREGVTWSREHIE